MRSNYVGNTPLASDAEEASNRMSASASGNDGAVDLASCPKDGQTYEYVGGKWVVYHGLDADGNVRYIGITSRDPEIRFAEHYNSGTERASLYYKTIRDAGNLQKIDARIMEQNLINQYGLDNLYNKINSISPKYWNQYNITMPLH